MPPPTSLPAQPRNEPPLDPQRWVERHADYLFRYAVGRVGRREVAEELVQDTLLAAWRGRAKYGGRASERSWLTAILKRKVIDWLRATVRDRERDDPPTADKTTDRLFTSGGRWRSGPSGWASDTPDAGAEREEFWAVVAGCTQKLPSRLRDVFVLWHLDERPSADVCRASGVKANNLWVMLHRARLRMWRCLSLGWYGIEPDERSERREEP